MPRGEMAESAVTDSDMAIVSRPERGLLSTDSLQGGSPRLRNCVRNYRRITMAIQAQGVKEVRGLPPTLRHLLPVKIPIAAALSSVWRSQDPDPARAVTVISTWAPAGNPLTSTVVRPGGLAVKYSA